MITWLNDVVLVQIDCENGEGIDLAKTYNIQGYPTFVMADPSARTVYRWMGYTKEAFLHKVGAGLSDLTPIEEKEKRFAGRPDLPTALVLAEYAESTGKLRQAVDYYQEAARLDPDNDYAYALFQLYRWGNRKQTFTEEQVKESAGAALASPYTDDGSRFWVLYAMAGYAAQDPDNQQLREDVSKAEKLINDKPDVAPERYKKDISIYYTLLIDKNKEKAVELKKSNMAEGWMDNAGDLNEFSWWCFENHVDLEEAEKLARRGIKLAEPGHEKAMILDTCAEIVNALGNHADAMELTKLAIKEDPDSKYYQAQLKRFADASQVQ